MTSKSRPRLVKSSNERGEPIVEIAHEALLSSWPRLASWIDIAKRDLYLLRQVRSAAVEWSESGRTDAYLWPEERLASEKSTR